MSYDPNQPYGQPQPPYNQPPTQYTPPTPDYGQPPYSQPAYEQPPYGQPQYGAPVAGYPQYQQAPQKSSLRWLWITLAIVGGLLVLGCAGCIFASALGIGFFTKSILGPTTSATGYYQAIKDQKYDVASSYLDTSGATINGQPVTGTAFVSAAQAQDQAKGPVTSFAQTNINVSSNNGQNTATVTMSVTRNGPPYTVVLQLKQVGNAWKITSADNL